MSDLTALAYLQMSFPNLTTMIHIVKDDRSRLKANFPTVRDEIFDLFILLMILLIDL